MKFIFPYKREKSAIFSTIRRPIVNVGFWSKKFGIFQEVEAIVDSGADYTLLPLAYVEFLGIDIRKDCRSFFTSGIGGSEKMFMAPKMRLKIGNIVLHAPIGFLRRDNIPPLLGRFGCLDKLFVLLSRYNTTIWK